MRLAVSLVEDMHTMKTSQLTKKIGTAIFGLSLMLGLGVAMGTTAQAQDPWRGQQDRRDRDYNRNRGGTVASERGRAVTILSQLGWIIPASPDCLECWL